MPKVVIEEFVASGADEKSEDEDNCDCAKVGKPHTLLTHHEIDDVSALLFNLDFDFGCLVCKS
jgi:hypothetical protein